MTESAACPNPIIFEDDTSNDEDPINSTLKKSI